MAVAQPLLQLYSGGLAVFSAAHIEGYAVLLFALMVLLLPPIALLGVEVVVGAIFPSRRHVAYRVMVA